MTKYDGAKLLVVGAGGIGCELLKTSIVTGFEYITIIDFDTIEVSNLNRQFLFNKSHIGLSKAIVAKDSILKINPDAKIIAHHCDVKSSQFDVDFFKSFDIVLNALDNRSARSHVNKMCIIANIPLIDGGTAGFLGQLHVIRKSITACYDCVPKLDNKRKSYPICTIRNTPSEMIHCVVWSKYLFELLFTLSTDTNGCGDTLIKNNENDQDIVEDDETVISTKIKELENNDDSIGKFVHLLVTKYFKDDINKLCNMEELWTTREKPVALKENDLDLVQNESVMNQKSLDPFITTTTNDYISVFIHSTKNLIQRWFSNKSIKWDKDDDLIIDFTTSAANIRANIFNIPFETKFEIKSMAGNIIPAIATTNAIIAGLMVAEAIKIVNGNIDKCHSIYISKNVTPSSKILLPCKPDLPNPTCPVCIDKPYLILVMNINNTSINQLEQFLKEYCGISKPDVLDQRTGNIIISSDRDDMTNVNSSEYITFFGITNGSLLTVEDFDNDFTIEIIIKHRSDMASSGAIESAIEIENKNLMTNIEQLNVSKRSLSVSGIEENYLHSNNKIAKISTPSESDDDLIVQENSSDLECTIITQ